MKRYIILAVCISFCLGFWSAQTTNVKAVHAAQQVQYNVESFASNSGASYVQEFLNKHAANGWYLYKIEPVGPPYRLYIFTNVSPQK